MAITERSGPRGTSYRVTYRDHEGKQRSAGTFKDSEEAKKAERRALSLRDDKIIAAPHKPVVLYAEERKGCPTLAVYATDVWLPNAEIGNHARENYLRVLQARVIPALGHKSLAEITSQDIRSLYRSMETDPAGLSFGYLAKVKSIFTGVYQMAIEDPAIPQVVSNPSYGIRHKGQKNGRRKAITKEEFVKLLDALPPHYRLLVRTIAGSGVRWEEAMGLKDTSLDAHDVLTIDHVLEELADERRFNYRFGTKNGSTRRIGIDHTLAEELRTLPAGFMFLNMHGNHIGGSDFRQKIWKPALKRAGLPDTLTPRDIRRVHATWLRDTGMKLEAIRDRLGHHDISITDRYLGADDSGDDECVRALGKIPDVLSKTGETYTAVIRRTRKRPAA